MYVMLKRGTGLALRPSAQAWHTKLSHFDSEGMSFAPCQRWCQLDSAKTVVWKPRGFQFEGFRTLRGQGAERSLSFSSSSCFSVRLADNVLRAGSLSPLSAVGH